MPNKYLDRGTPLDGINTTLRDARVPHNLPRSLKNFRLPDKRLVRRRGFAEWSAARVEGNQLKKCTGTFLKSMYGADDGANTKSYRQYQWYRNPNSYGLIRWHTDFQPKIGADWTVEFLLTLGDEEPLVTERFARESQSVDGSGDEVFGLRAGYNGSIAVDQVGVYVYDQTVLANDCSFSDAGTGAAEHNLPKTGNATTSAFETVALPALSIAYARDGTDVTVDVGFCTVGTATDASTTADVYYRYVITRLLSGTTYAAGDTYHVAVTYKASTGQISLYVTAIGAGSIDASPTQLTITTTNRAWAGEDDSINNRAVGGTNAIKRDIVILNECTVRGHYASTCAIQGVGNGSTAGTSIAGAQNIFIHNERGNDDVQQTNPWACSPSRGTGLMELRWWSDLRTTTELNNNKAKPVATGNNLIGYWRCVEGSGIIKDQVANGGVAKAMSLHHAPPHWVADDDMLNDIGLHISDGQYLIRSYGPLDFKYAVDSAVMVRNVFTPRRGHDASNSVDGRSDFTVQMQVKTPYTFQQNIANHGTAGAAEGLQWWDGSYDTVGTLTKQRRAVATSAGVAHQRTDAYQSTLFSIEGVQSAMDDSNNPVSTSDTEIHTAVPLAQAQMMPDGKVQFRTFHRYGDNSGKAAFYEVVSAAALTADTEYVLTFRKIVEDRDGTVKMYLEIFVDGVLSQKAEFDASSDHDSSFCEHNLIPLTMDNSANAVSSTRSSRYDIIIGASKVNDIRDEDIAVGHDETAEPNRLKYGNQHYMGPWSDQPGFFTLGFFRLWGNPLGDEEIKDFGTQSIINRVQDENLIYNIELDRVTGTQVVSKSRYADVFELGFKSFGISYPNVTQPASVVVDGIPECPSAWSMQDCLGYGSQPTGFDNDPAIATTLRSQPDCQGLLDYNSALEQESGILAIWDNAIEYDEGNSRTFAELLLTSHGMLSDFASDQPWYGTTIADRTFLTSEGGIPKVFTGKIATAAGAKRWNGGFIETDAVVPTSTSDLTPLRWYGVDLVFVSEKHGLSYIAPRSLVYTTAANTSIRVRQIPDNFDPRVTSIYIYRTLAHHTRPLAEASTSFLIGEEPLPLELMLGNDSTAGFELTKGDTELVLGAPLDRSLAPFPEGRLSASMGGRLWILGSLTEPDAVFWSDTGQPEVFRRGSKLILEEARGDRIEGAAAVFGSLFVFKTNSIWRIDEVAPGQMRSLKLTEDLGAISDRSILVVTLPDSGRAVVFFWSRHGPYLFDGSNFNYIGAPLENNFTNPAYHDIDTKSTFVLHDPGDKEIIVFYKSQNNSYSENADSRTDRAFVYNYRFQVWYQYTGMLANAALTTVATNTTPAESPGATPEALSLSSTKTFLAVFGAEGMVYRWGADSTGAAVLVDGRPSGFSYDDLSISSYNAGVVTVGGTPGWTAGALRGLWVTIYKISSGAIIDWISIPIKENGASGPDDTLTLDTDYWALANWKGTLGTTFTPAAGDKVSVGFMPAEVEFPWDTLDALAVDKELVRLKHWHAGAMYFRYATDRSTTYTTWSLLDESTTGPQRKGKEINKNCELYKLQMMGKNSATTSANRLDAYGYEVVYTDDTYRTE